jgi:hypothetical protein
MNEMDAGLEVPKIRVPRIPPPVVRRQASPASQPVFVRVGRAAQASGAGGAGAGSTAGVTKQAKPAAVTMRQSDGQRDRRGENKTGERVPHGKAPRMVGSVQASEARVRSGGRRERSPQVTMPEAAVSRRARRA